MAFLIKNLSSKEIDELVMNSTNPHNSMSIDIPILYIQNLIELTWSDICCFIKLEYCSKTIAIKHANDIIAENSDDLIYDLAICDQYDTDDFSFMDKVIQLSNQESCEVKQNAMRKVFYTVLNYLYDNREFIKEPIQVLDIVYDDFGFPDNFNDTMNRIHCLKQIKSRNSEALELLKEFLIIEENNVSAG